MDHKLKFGAVVLPMPSDPIALMDDLVVFMTSVTRDAVSV